MSEATPGAGHPEAETRRHGSGRDRRSDRGGVDRPRSAKRPRPRATATRADTLTDDDLRALLPAIEPERRSTTGGAPSASRASSTARSSSSSTASGSAARSRAIEHVPARRRRAARLQPRRRAAARRGDDRQGDQGGAPARRARSTSPSSTSSRATPASACCCRRSAASPPTRPTSTACSYDEQRARARVPRGPQGHREALQGPLPAAPLRPRRLRRGGDARPRADRPGRRRRRRGGRADLRPRPGAAAPDRASSTSRSRRPSRTSGSLGMLGYLPAKFKHPLPAAGPDRRHGRRAVGGQGARPDRRRTRSAPRSRSERARHGRRAPHACGSERER